MSDLTADANILGGIVSNFFDGKTNLEATASALGSLGSTIVRQISTEAGKVETALGPAATADINQGIADIQQVAGGAITLLDADVAPYLASGAKAVEDALDTVLNAAVPGSAALNPLVNGGIDAIANGLKAALDAQALAWKAKLAGNTTTTTTVAAG